MENDIRRRVAEVCAHRFQAQNLPEPKKSILNRVLFVCILLLGGITGFVYYSKTHINQSKLIAETPQNLVRDDSRLVSLEATLKLLKHRMWLLAIANNENAAMSKQIDKKLHPGEPNDYLILDKDWKLDRMPRTQIIDPEDDISQSIK